MNKLLNLIIILLILVFASCHKRLPKCKTVAGEVNFKIKDGITLKQINTLMVKYNIEHYSLGNFFYTKAIPADSEAYYYDLLSNCKYIALGDYSRTPVDSFTKFPIDFRTLNKVNYSKWDSIVVKEQLNEMTIPNNGWALRNGSIYITKGQEEYWINTLKSCHEISSADYVYTEPLTCVK